MQQYRKTRTLNSKKLPYPTWPGNTFLQAVLEPAEVAVIHCKGHQGGNTDIITENNLPNTAAKRAALQLAPLQTGLFPHNSVPQQRPQYTQKENGWDQKQKYQRNPKQWWELNYWLFLPQNSQ